MQASIVRAAGRRRGFTLIELIVVMSIILILIALVAGLTPKITGKRKMNKAVEQVVGALKAAKQRAKRDGLPTGIRLAPSSTLATSSPQYIQELIPIQQPEPLMGGPGAALIAKASQQVIPDPNMSSQPLKLLGTRVVFNGVDFTGGFPNSQQQRWLVQKGDYLEVCGGGLLHYIAGVSSRQLTLAQPQAQVLNPQYDPFKSAMNGATYIGDENIATFRIIRQPRALIGEVSVHLAPDIAIDISAGVSSNVPSNPATNNLDVVFSPSGALLNGGSGSDAVILWVRDITQADPYKGEPALVTIYSRTGFIAVHPVALKPLNPYQFTTDGRVSGW